MTSLEVTGYFPDPLNGIKNVQQRLQMLANNLPQTLSLTRGLPPLHQQKIRIGPEQPGKVRKFPERSGKVRKTKNSKIKIVKFTLKAVFEPFKGSKVKSWPLRANCSEKVTPNPNPSAEPLTLTLALTVRPELALA